MDEIDLFGIKVPNKSAIVKSKRILLNGDLKDFLSNHYVRFYRLITTDITYENHRVQHFTVSYFGFYSKSRVISIT